MIEFESITDRPADHLDQAGKETERTTVMAVAMIRAELAVIGVSADDCEECGAEIPIERQIAEAGCQLCWDCKTKAEIAAKGVRRG